MLALEVIEVASTSLVSSLPATATSIASHAKAITVMAWEERGYKRGSISRWATQ